MSSDKQYLILFNEYLDMEHLKTCKTKMKPFQITVGDLSDMNKKKSIFIGINEYELDWNCAIASIRKIPTGEKINIAAKPFYAQKNPKEPCARIPLVVVAVFHQTAIILPCHYLISPAAKAVTPACTIHEAGKSGVHHSGCRRPLRCPVSQPAHPQPHPGTTLRG
jgi:hypothetical protein